MTHGTETYTPGQIPTEVKSTVDDYTCVIKPPQPGKTTDWEIRLIHNDGSLPVVNETNVKGPNLPELVISIVKFTTDAIQRKTNN